MFKKLKLLTYLSLSILINYLIVLPMTIVGHLSYFILENYCLLMCKIEDFSTYLENQYIYQTDCYIKPSLKDELLQQSNTENTNAKTGSE